MLRTSRNQATRKQSGSVKGSKSGGRHPAIQRIQALIDGQKWKQAWAELKPWLGREPNNATLHWVAGLLQSELGNPEKARTYLRFAAEHIQDDPGLFERLGEAERALGDSAAAERAFQRAEAFSAACRRCSRSARRIKRAGSAPKRSRCSRKPMRSRATIRGSLCGWRIFTKKASTRRRRSSGRWRQ